MTNMSKFHVVFCWIFGRFGDDLGAGLGSLFADFGQLWEVQGVSWRRQRAVFSTGRPPGGPRERSGINLASFRGLSRIWPLFATVIVRAVAPQGGASTIFE